MALGKGGHARIVPIPAELVDILTALPHRRGPVIRRGDSVRNLEHWAIRPAAARGSAPHHRGTLPGRGARAQAPRQGDRPTGRRPGVARIDPGTAPRQATVGATGDRHARRSRGVGELMSYQQQPGYPPQMPFGPAHDEPPRARYAPRPWWRRGWFVAPFSMMIGVLVGAGVASTGGTTTTTTSSGPSAAAAGPASAAKPAPAKASAAAPAKPAAPKVVTIEDGTWVVGEDVPAGTYKVTEPIADPGVGGCYWAITKSGSNGGDIIQNDIPAGGRPKVVLRKGQDFSTQRCGTWAKVG